MKTVLAAAGLIVMGFSTPAGAESPLAASGSGAAQEAVAPSAPPPYSLPWQLRPAVPVNAIRSDLALAFYRDPLTREQGFAAVESLIALVKLESWVAVGARATAIGNAPPGAAGGSGAFANPVVFGLFSFRAGDFRIAPSLSLVLPLGMGGGNAPDVGPDAAIKTAVRVRSAMDNAVFSPNYVVIVPGIDVAWIRAGFTVQAEATLLELVRVKGAAASPDDAITNFTMGLHLGYFFVPQVSIGTELRHQRVLTTPKAVAADEALAPDKQLGLRDTTTFAVGPRLHFKIGQTAWIRPGLAYTRAFDSPMSKARYSIVQVDVPVIF